MTVLSLAGCSTTIDGVGTPVGMRYRGTLTSDDAAAKLAERDEIRRLDPCGMLDERAVNTLGRPLHFGIGIDLDRCVVRLDRATLTTPLNSVEVSMSVSLDFAGSRFQLGNRKASEIHSGDQCFVAVEYNDRRALFYSGIASGGADPCPALRTVVAASAPLLDKPALRRNSTKIPKTKGADVDLCAALDTAYPSGQAFYLTGLNPYECDFWLGDHQRDDSNRFTIQLFNANKSLVGYVPADARKLQIAGVDAVEQSFQKNYCTIQAYIGASQPISARDWEGKPDDRVEALKVSGRGCDKTRTLALAAVKTYQQN
ncbi:hypothetical protein [Nocardia sp. XZ_19_369]|uniref:hypothetical protein n=1 Tax=Nocardia sp. XZ_19_369 TaxID=2769487 RepID=UPI00188DF823|nr:hypothetical protein [Nocardia sp. XZ_19_369]